MLEVIILIAYVILTLMLALIIRQLRRVKKQFRAPHYTSHMATEVDLPSVTVCIPARNEHHALAACLDRVIESTYARLEIIVLDDVSGDDTSELIKAYASKGVRFVQGKALPKGWLGKNHALQGLLNEASGSYVLFLDVDTVLSNKAIEHIVRYSLSHRASMVSVLPRREDSYRASALFSPLRYFWEILFHRRFWPATASSAWLIRRKVLLNRFNGFTGFKNAIQPETKLAAELAQTNEYRFLVGSHKFGVAYEKKWRSQLLTSVRLLFPLFNEQVAISIIALLDLALLFVPYVIIMSMFFVPFSWVHPVAVLLALGFAATYGWYARQVWHSGWLAGAALWPYLLVQEAVLIVVSTIQYKRKAVTWKGRSIRPEAQS